MSGEFQLTYAPHPLKQERHVIPVPEGLTIQQIIDTVIPDEGLRPYAIPFMRGTRIPADKWPHVRPKSGSHLELRIGPRGGGDKDVLGIVLTIAVIALAIAAPELLVAAGIFTEAGIAAAVGATTVGGLITAGVGLVGMLLVNALVPAPTPKLGNLSGFGGTGQTSPTLFIQGARNASRPFSPVPSVLGRHRRYPEFATRPYTEVIGEDNYARMMFVWGIGPLAIDTSTLKIGETLLSEFEGVQVQHDEGYPDTTPDLSLYPDTVIQDDSSVLLTVAGGWATRTSEENVDELSIDLTFPQGLVGYPNDQAAVNASGPGPYTLLNIAEINYREVGSTDWLIPTFTAKTIPDEWVGTNTIASQTFGNGEVAFFHAKSAAVRHGFRWDVPARGQYEVRVRKTYDYGDVSTYRQALYWTALRSITNEDPISSPVRVARTVLVIKATDQLNRVVDEFNAVVTSVGKDFDATSPTSWVDDQEITNPASLFRHVLQGNAIAEPLADSRIDLTKLEEWHTFCEDKGYKFNMVRDFRSSVWDTLTDVCQAGRAAPTHVDGKWSVVIDQEQSTPVSHITPRNSFSFALEKVFLDLPHAWRVRFSNENEGYRSDEYIVYRDGYTSANATKFESLELSGVTDPDQVYNLARWRLLQGIHQPERWTISQDMEYLTYQRGDRVLVTHDVLLSGLKSARVSSVDVDTNNDVTRVYLDETVTFTGGDAFGISVRNTNAVQTTTQVDNPAVLDGDPVEQAYVDPVTAIPNSGGNPSVAAGDIVAFGYVTNETDDGLVIAITPQEDFRAQVVMVPYREEIYATDSETVPTFNTNLTPLPTIPTPNITGVVTDETVLDIGPGGSAIARMAIDFDPNDFAYLDDPAIDVQLSLTATGEPFKNAKIESVSPGRVIIGDVIQGQVWDARVRFRVAGRLPGSWAYSYNNTIVGRSTAPASLANLTASAIKGGTVILRWDAPLEIDVRFGGTVTWRHSQLTDGTATWGDSTSIGTSSRANDLIAHLPLKEGTYLGRVFDSAGNPSDTVSSFIIKKSDFDALTTSETIDEAPTFSGTKTTCEVTGSSLTISLDGLFDDITDFDALDSLDGWGDVEPSATYEFANSLDLTTTTEIQLTSRVTSSITAIGDTMDDRTNNIDTWESFDGTAAEQALVDCVVYVRWTTDDPAATGAAWSEWERLDSAVYNARGFEFKAILTTVNPSYNILVTELGIDGETVAGN